MESNQTTASGEITLITGLGRTVVSRTTADEWCQRRSTQAQTKAASSRHT